MAGKSEGMRGVVEEEEDRQRRLVVTRYLPKVDLHRILWARDSSPVRFELGCVVIEHPYLYELVQQQQQGDDDAAEEGILSNDAFLAVHEELMRHECTGPLDGKPVTRRSSDGRRVIHVTPSDKPRLRVTSDLILKRGGRAPIIKADDVVILHIELRYLHRNRSSYTICPLHLHVCDELQ